MLRAHDLPEWADCFFQFGPERAAGDAALVGWVVGEGAVEIERLPEVEQRRLTRRPGSGRAGRSFIARGGLPHRSRTAALWAPQPSLGCCHPAVQALKPLRAAQDPGFTAWGRAYPGGASPRRDRRAASLRAARARAACAAPQSVAIRPADVRPAWPKCLARRRARDPPPPRQRPILFLLVQVCPLNPVGDSPTAWRAEGGCGGALVPA